MENKCYICNEKAVDTIGIGQTKYDLCEKCRKLFIETIKKYDKYKE